MWPDAAIKSGPFLPNIAQQQLLLTYIVFLIVTIIVIWLIFVLKIVLPSLLKNIISLVTLTAKCDHPIIHFFLVVQTFWVESVLDDKIAFQFLC